MAFRATYTENKLASADIVTFHVNVCCSFPLLLCLLEFSTGSDIDRPAIVLESIASSLDGHLVIGKGVGGRDSLLGHLQLA